MKIRRYFYKCKEKNLTDVALCGILTFVEVLRVKDLNISALLDVYGEFLSQKQRDFTEYYYNDDLSLSEIAENEGVTRQGVNDLIKRAVAQMTAWEEKCGYCKKFLRLKELSENNNINQEIKAIIENL